MKKWIVFALAVAVIPFLPSSAGAEGMKGHKSPEKMNMAAVASKAPDSAAMPDPGKKVAIGDGYYLVYGFDKKPKLGTIIMKVDIFTADGAKDTSYAVRADAGMPSMRGAHETGERPFQLSKKGSYLLPISIVMPGDWEIRLSVLKGGQVIFRGRYNFDI
jgi:hypothetical protein